MMLWRNSVSRYPFPLLLQAVPDVRKIFAMFSEKERVMQLSLPVFFTTESYLFPN